MVLKYDTMSPLAQSSVGAGVGLHRWSIIRRPKIEPTTSGAVAYDQGDISNC